MNKSRSPHRSMASSARAADAAAPAAPAAQHHGHSLTAGATHAAGAALDVVPFNAERLEEMRDQWAAANWRAIAARRVERLDGHPDRGPLAIVNAAALLQLGDRRAARELASSAAGWNCEPRFIAKVLLASAHHALGRASAAAGRDAQAEQHFQRSLFEPRLLSEARRVATARMDEAAADLAKRREFAVRDRKAGVEPVGKSRFNWINELVAHCLAAEDLHEAVDGVLDQLVVSADDRVRFLMRLAAHFKAEQDKHIAVNYLNTAKEIAAECSKELRRELAKQFTAFGQPALAMDLLVEDALSDVEGEPKADTFVQTVRKAYQDVREAEQSKREHGHELLLAYLKQQLAKLPSRPGLPPLSLVEIGTTRESVPGQGSTRRLGDFCAEHGMAFVTVDMDPHNSLVAKRMFESRGWPFEAVTMKGEDYLRERTAPVDFVFLDAYDFDHGKHSELRQSRYLKFLGSRIDEQACHQMHLDCAESVIRLLAPGGAVCIDDTWRQNDRWTAKGTLAMPYLLENGFELIDARNRAVLLRRKPAAA